MDLAICDIEMPDQSGLELMGWIEEHPRTRRRSFSAVTMSLLTPSRPCACTAWSMLKPVRYEVLTEVLERAVKSINDKRERSVMTEYGQRYIESIRGDDAAIPEILWRRWRTISIPIWRKTFSVNALAGMAFLSADHLTRSFKKRYGKTVSEYILSQRMQL